MIEADKKTFSFGDFELSGAKRTLLKRGEIISLNSKTFDLLFTLIENHGKILSKDELLDKVWEGQFVEENNLTVQISALRKIFGESKNENKFIATIPGKGYKFVAEITVPANENSRDLIVFEKTLPVSTREKFETTLIGRAREIAEIKDLLRQGEVNLLTLTGAGGSGKTSLAREIAAELETDFADGVFFVELAAATETNFVVSAITNTLGITESGGKSLVETVKDFLRTRQTLVVLDNFEQVLTAAPLVKEFLAEDTQLKIVVTSRAALRLKSEREFHVHPLELPPPNASFSIENLNEFPAIELFKTRAQNVKPNFAITGENIKTVAEICRRLDGLPLAIELAAVRVKLLAPQAILERLEQSLKLLTGGAKDAPERQRTMRDTIRWSYDLLDESEQFLFRRLAIFAGGFSIESAEFVGSSSPIDTLNLLDSLIDNNLLVSKEQADGNARLQMLEVVREFAFEVLREKGELDDLRRIHVRYFLDFAVEAGQFLHGDTGNSWLGKLLIEYNNFRAALSWSLENEPDTSAQVAAALCPLWMNHSYLSEGLRRCEAVLQKTENSLSEARLKLLAMSGFIYRNRGDLETARKIYEKGLAESRKLNNSMRICSNYQGLGAVAVLEKDYEAAENFYRQGLDLSRRENEEMATGYLLHSMVDLEMCRGNWSAARLLLEESLIHSKKLDDKRMLMTVYFNRGTIDYHENLYQAAASSFAESLNLAGEMGNIPLISYSLDGFAALAAKNGKFEKSAELAGAAQGLRESIDYKIELAEEIFRDKYLAETRAALSENQFAALYLQGQTLNSDEAAALVFQKQLTEQGDFADENFSEIIIETHKFERITINEKIEP